MIPRHLLGDAADVEIRKENGIGVVIPLPADDPILGLGSQPVSADLPDASAAHDRELCHMPEHICQVAVPPSAIRVSRGSSWRSRHTYPTRPVRPRCWG
ncbi:hypothetical protein AWN76_012410 [Rhodothermaceae bacterium RA]|nr:hypothetical protein AWN76_012410 [Rhodothermaceae bacterium RA]